MSKTVKTSFTKLIFSLLYILIFPNLLLWIGGNWCWTEGIIFNCWFVALCYTTIIYIYYKDPALLNERYQQVGSGNQKAWDRWVVVGLGIGFIGWIVLMPLDAVRFQWTQTFPQFVKIIGMVMLLCSSFLFFRSYKDNTFLSPLVRIQNERKQKVITTGVYGFVRHPMYLGAILMFIGAPLLMSSFVGIAMGIALVILIGARTIGEEATLENELEGYAEYKQKVRYRFFPYIW